MNTVTQIAKAMQYVLRDRANELGRSTGFIKRQRKLTGASFCQATVFAWLANSEASMETLSQSAANVNVAISRQGLDERFTPEAAKFLRAVLEESVAQVIKTNGVNNPVLSQFTEVRLIDSTTIVLPDELETVWKGCEGSALKVSVCWDILHGALNAVHLHSAREHDQLAPLQKERMPTGSLRIADLGYFKIDVLRQITEDGSYWVTRYKQRTKVYHPDGTEFDLVRYLARQDAPIIDLPILLGANERLKCRMVAERVSDALLKKRQKKLRRWESRKQKKASPQRWALLAWTIYLTNVDSEKLPPQTVIDLGHVRWQIELLFKLWKDVIDIDDWRTKNIWRILCETYGKLIACIIQHWLMLTANIHELDRSMTQAAHTIQNKAWQLAEFINNRYLLIRTIRKIRMILQAGCRISPSSTSPPTFQRFLA